jgi:hypothetical protein
MEMKNTMIQQETNKTLTSLKHKINNMVIKAHDNGLYGTVDELTSIGDYLDNLRDYESDKQIRKIINTTIKQLDELDLKYNEIVSYENQCNNLNSILIQNSNQSVCIES